MRANVGAASQPAESSRIARTVSPFHPLPSPPPPHLDSPSEESLQSDEGGVSLDEQVRVRPVLMRPDSACDSARQTEEELQRGHGVDLSVHESLDAAALDARTGPRARVLSDLALLARVDDRAVDEARVAQPAAAEEQVVQAQKLLLRRERG